MEIIIYSLIIVISFAIIINLPETPKKQKENTKNIQEVENISEQVKSLGADTNSFSEQCAKNSLQKQKETESRIIGGLISPICRFKYLLYILVDGFILAMVLQNSPISEMIVYREKCGLAFLVLNFLIVIPYLIAKRTKDTGFSVSVSLLIWYGSLITNILFPNVFQRGFFIPLCVLQVYLIFKKGHYDTFNIILLLKNLLEKVLFLNYIKNIGVKRLCFVSAIVLAILFYFNSISFVIGFYIPFVITATGQWICNGFNKSK